MDLIKNIGKEFIIDGETFKKVINEPHVKFDGTIGEVKAKVLSIDMYETEFYITSIDKVEEIVDNIVTGLITKLVKDVKIVKKAYNKVIKAWVETPEKFEFLKDKYSHENIYLRKDLLNSNEYSANIHVSFNKYFKSGDYDGYGSKDESLIYYDKEYYVDKMEGIDTFHKTIEKELNSKKIKDRFKKYILNYTVKVPHNKLESQVKLINTPELIIEPIEKPTFPIDFDGDTLNSLLYNINGYGEINQKFINAFKEENDFDISPLLDWEIEYEHEGDHYNDGQMCEYTVTFSSPEGHTYFAYDTHCLMTGWDFYEVEIY